jgi:hypothetical protein
LLVQIINFIRRLIITIVIPATRQSLPFFKNRGFSGAPFIGWAKYRVFEGKSGFKKKG